MCVSGWVERVYEDVCMRGCVRGRVREGVREGV